MAWTSSKTVADAERHPVLKRYAPRRVKVPLGPSPLPLVLPDAGALIRGGAWADERAAEPPYWMDVWPASVAAARTLFRLRGGPGRPRVLDLGCGLGLPGLAAALAGCDVTFADLHPDALAFAEWNLRALAPDATASFCRVDWSRDVVAGRFDVLVLSDVSYRPVHHLALHRHVDGCLADDGVVVHADPSRAEATPFVKALQQTHHALLHSAKVTYGIRTQTIRVCLAARRAEAPLLMRLGKAPNEVRA